MTWRDKEIASCLSNIQSYRHRLEELRNGTAIPTDAPSNPEVASLQGALLRQEARLRKLDPDDLLD